MSRNPYEPPSDYREDPRKPETDWAGFIFVVSMLIIIFWHRPLVNFFVIIFRKLLYSE